jgi:hypothetical protein
MTRKLTLTYSCGHSETYRWSRSGSNRPFRNSAHRARIIAEASISLCDRCARSRESEMAVREAILDALVPLHGSPRQAAWATIIRSDRLHSMRENIASGAYLNQAAHLDRIGDPSDPHRTVAALRAKYPTYDLTAAVMHAVLHIDQADWWIRTRKIPDNSILISIAAELLSDIDDRRGRTGDPIKRGGGPTEPLKPLVRQC